jgi:phage-related protein
VSEDGPTPRRLGLRFYRTPAGAAPVRDWLRGLTHEARRQIGWDVGLVQERWPVGRPLVGRLGGGLCEVRTTFDKNEYRVFFYIEREQVVVVHSTMVLVTGFTRRRRKRRQRTSRSLSVA